MLVGYNATLFVVYWIVIKLIINYILVLKTQVFYIVSRSGLKCRIDVSYKVNVCKTVNSFAVFEVKRFSNFYRPPKTYYGYKGPFYFNDLKF